MKTILQKTYIPIIILGVIAFTTFSVFGGILPTVLKQQSINIGSYTWNYYTFDIRLYLQNIQNSFSADIFKLSVAEIPQQPTPYTGWDVTKYLEYIVNVLIYILNWLIWIVDMVLFYPLKLLFYPVRVIYTLVGLDTSSFEFIKAIEIVTGLNIPLVPYVTF